MLLNGMSVAASLIEKGEDNVLNRTNLAKLFSLNKSALTGARERTGCYSLTRYHLNEAAACLGIHTSDFKYRVTPKMLSTDGSGKVEVSGQQGADLGARQLDPAASYNADVTTNASIERLVTDSSGMILKGENPKELKNRFELIQQVASDNGGSMAVALLGACDVSTLVRYNAKRISEFKDLGEYEPEVAKQAAGLTHLGLALFGAATTGAALSITRRFLTRGQLSAYDEWDIFAKWLKDYANSVAHAPMATTSAETNSNAVITQLIDLQAEARNFYAQDEQTKLARTAYQDARYIRSVVSNKLIADFSKNLAGGIVARQELGEKLDIDELVKRANKVLASTPQLIRK